MNACVLAQCWLARFSPPNSQVTACTAGDAGAGGDAGTGGGEGAGESHSIRVFFSVYCLMVWISILEIS